MLMLKIRTQVREVYEFSLSTYMFVIFVIYRIHQGMEPRAPKDPSYLGLTAVLNISTGLLQPACLP